MGLGEFAVVVVIAIVLSLEVDGHADQNESIGIPSSNRTTTPRKLLQRFHDVGELQVKTASNDIVVDNMNG